MKFSSYGFNKALLLAGFCFLIAHNISAQRLSQAQRDSVRKHYQDSIRTHIEDSIRDERLKADTVIPIIVSKVETYSVSISRSNSYLRRKFDTSSIAKELPKIEWALTSLKNRLDSPGFKPNIRSINTLQIIAQESGDKLVEWQKTLNEHSENIAANNKVVKNILNDKVLLTSTNDTALASKVKKLIQKARSMDSLQNQSLIKLNLLRNRVALSSLIANDIISDLNFRNMMAKISMWKKEESPLLSARPSNYKMSLWAVFKNTIDKSFRVLPLYAADNWGGIAFGLVIGAALFMLCKRSFGKVRRSRLAEFSKPLHFINKSLALSCLLLLFAFGPFFYNNPPQIFTHISEMGRQICVTLLLYRYLSVKARKYWIWFLALWACYSLDDLFIESTFGERWFLFAAAIAVITLCINIFRNKKELFTGGIPEAPATRLITSITLILSVLSILFNLSGLTTLSKLFGNCSIQIFVLAVALRMFSIIILEIVYLIIERFRNSRLSGLWDFEILQKKLKFILGIFVTVIWLAALFQNLTIYSSIYKLLGHFFTQPRTIGNISFSFQSLAIFAFILWLSSILSQLISFLFSNDQITRKGKRNNVGSIRLLLRIAIWSIGFLLAIGAAGIPLEKVSIMIGALSVGIGFGLQNVVNNLVSGIILAFERPIQIGDAVEIGNKTGIVKEIGVRSSKITSYEGAEIVVPNGDLLSQHIINWTLVNRYKRMEVVIGVAYNTDIRKAKELIESILAKNERLMTDPAPFVMVNNFGESSVDFKIFFWVRDLADAGGIRSGVMIDIFEAFGAAGIEIPFPKRDVYIKEIKNNDEQKMKNEE